MAGGESAVSLSAFLSVRKLRKNDGLAGDLAVGKISARRTGAIHRL